MIGFFISSASASRGRFKRTKFLLFDQIDITTYRNRLLSGPFKSDDDFITNSPGDWDRILIDADAFVLSPELSRWDNLPTELVTDLEGANPVSNYEPTSDQITPMVAAAFVYAVTKNIVYGNAVRAELYDFYRVQSGLNMLDTNLWDADDLDDSDFFIAGGFTKLLYAYDMTKDLFGATQRGNMDTFFSIAAEYFQSSVNSYLTGVFDGGVRESSFSGVWDDPSEALDTDDNAKTHHGGNLIYNFNKFYNNRRNEQVKYFLAVGIFLRDNSLINDAKLYFREWLKFGVFPDGTLPELGTRFVDSDGSRETGYFYSCVSIGTMCEMATSLLLSGDSYFFNYETSSGQLSTVGGPKNLRLVIDKFNSLFKSKVSGTKLYVNSHDGEANYTIDGEESGQNPYIHHLFFLPANRYYKSLDLFQSGTLIHPDTNGLPATPRVVAGYNTWQGVFLSTPGIYFLHAKIGMPVRNIASILAFDDVEVSTGTAFGSLVLPSKATVTFNDGSSGELPISFLEGSYDGDVAGTYTLTGQLDLTGLSGVVTNNPPVPTTINVVVEVSESTLTVDSISVTEDTGILSASYVLGGTGTEKNQLPIARAVRMSGLFNVGEEILGLYTYEHINASPEGTTLFRWYTADDANGTNEAQVATTQNYTIELSDEGKYLRFEVIPVTGATQGNAFTSGYSTEAVQSTLVETVVLISFGSSTKNDLNLADSRTWNLAHTDDPTSSYELNNLIDENGNEITGLNIDVDLTMSDATPGAGGFTGAFDAGDGIAYPANFSVSYWYSTDGTTGRGFQIEIPVSLQGAPFEILLTGAENSGTNQLIARVNSIEKQIENVTNNTTQYLRWDYDDLDGASDFGQISVRIVDGSGLSPLGVMEIHFKTPAP